MTRFHGCTMLGLLAFAWSLTHLHAQTPGGRLQADDLEYLGAFRLPRTPEKLASRFPYGGHAVAFNPAGNDGKGSLFVAGHAHHQLVAEVSVPEPRKARDMADLATAELLQPFADVTGGLKKSTRERQMLLGGLLVHDKTLLWTIFKTYNVDGESLPSHGASTLRLDKPDAKGVWRVGPVHSQKTAGFLCAIPQAWQQSFGYPFLTGQSRMQGRATSSNGPAAYGFNPHVQGTFPADGAVVRTTEFLSYHDKQRANYTVNGTAHAWKGANRVAGMVFPVSEDQKKSALIYFVRVGLHPTDWYGDPAKFPGPGTPCESGSGYHAPPYKAAAWLYDPNDLIQVGRQQAMPGSLKPYAVKYLNTDLFGECAQISAATYDAKTRRIYLIEQSADPKDEFDRWPAVHVYGVK